MKHAMECRAVYDVSWMGHSGHHRLSSGGRRILAQMHHLGPCRLQATQILLVCGQVASAQLSAEVLQEAAQPPLALPGQPPPPPPPPPPLPPSVGARRSA